MQKPTKHILIVDGIGADAAINALGLVRLPADAPEARRDSCAPDSKTGRAQLRQPALMTRDGMQLYCFRQRFPYDDAHADGTPKDKAGFDPNHLNYWVWRLEDQLAKTRETLDAIILPARMSPEAYRHIVPLLQHAKAVNPALKVITVQERVSVDAANPTMIDTVISAARMKDFGSIVREQVGMPELPEELPPSTKHANAKIFKRLEAHGIDPVEFARGPHRSGRPRGNTTDDASPRGRGK